MDGKDVKFIDVETRWVIKQNISDELVNPFNYTVYLINVDRCRHLRKLLKEMYNLDE